MAEPGIAYQPWRSLDGDKRYYLVDTMELLEIYRRNARLASMVATVGGDRTPLLTPEVVDECAKVFDLHKPDTSSREYMYVSDESGEIYSYLEGPATEEDFDVALKSRGDFDRLLAQTLAGWDLKFTAGEPEQGTLDAARRMRAEKKYRNWKGVPLSRADCVILRLAVENGNVDVVTDDMVLAKAVSAECGPGRASNALAAYFGRLNMTARFLSRALDLGFVDCRPVRDAIECRARSRAAHRGEPRTRRVGGVGRPHHQRDWTKRDGRLGVRVPVVRPAGGDGVVLRVRGRRLEEVRRGVDQDRTGL